MKDFGFKTYEKLYESCVTPILDYAASVWGFKSQTDLESVQIRAIRYFMGLHRFAPHLALYGDIDWLPCTQTRWFHVVRFWNRLLTFDDNRLTKKGFPV